MIGIVGVPEVSPQLFLHFRELATSGRYLSSDGPSHLDGWGAGWFARDGQPRVHKSVVPILDRKSGFFSALAGLSADAPRIALGHLRKASVGGVATENTHPFEADGWLFCHNGTLFNAEHLPLVAHDPTGRTDSERFFLYLLEQMAGDGEQGIRRGIKQIQRYPYTSLTFLLTNGTVLIAYREIGASDEAPLAELRKYYALYAQARPNTWIICSEPLPMNGGQWKHLDDGELLILSRDAQLVRQVNLKESLQTSRL
jgi:predicted glutamine amidotransferase